MVGYIFWIVLSAAIAIWFMKLVEAQFAKAEAPLTASEGILVFIIPFIMPLVCFALSATIAGQITAIIFGIAIIVISLKWIPGYIGPKIAEIAVIAFCGIAQILKIGDLGTWAMIYAIIMLAIAIATAVASTDWAEKELGDEDFRNLSIAAVFLAIAVIAVMVTTNMLR
jgi:hypothetical protein